MITINCMYSMIWTVTYIDKAVVEMKANQGSRHSLLSVHGLLDFRLDDGVNLGA